MDYRCGAARVLRAGSSSLRATEAGALPCPPITATFDAATGRRDPRKPRRQAHPRRRPPINSAKPVEIWKDVGVVVDLTLPSHVRRVVMGVDREIYDNTNTMTSDSFMAAGDKSVSFLTSAIIILCCHPPQVRRAGQRTRLRPRPWGPWPRRSSTCHLSSYRSDIRIRRDVESRVDTPGEGDTPDQHMGVHRHHSCALEPTAPRDDMS